MTVFDFHGPFIFLNAERFKKCFEDSILHPIQLEHRGLVPCFGGQDTKMSRTTSRTVVFDMTPVSYVDSKTIECLLEIDAELAQLNVNFVLAGPSEQIIDCCIRCQMFDKFDSKRCFLTVHDAVVAANAGKEIAF